MKTESLWRRLRRKTASRGRRGVILILSTFLLVVMFGFAAFAIDLGYIVLTMQQLQNAADAAALAAVLELKTSDSSLTVAKMRENAVKEAIKAAGYNYAGNRSVDISDLTGTAAVGGSQIRFGNRHYNNATSSWESFYDGDSRLGQLPLNAVEVDIAFDQASGNRKQLGLLFAPVIGRRLQTVGGTSSSHLTPRDLSFVLDISGSMGDDTPTSEYQGLVFPLWASLGQSNYKSNTAATIDKAYDQNYQYLWTQLTNTSSASSSKGIFGTNAANITTFAEQEFGDCPVVSGVKQYWNHWKWQAFCDTYAQKANNAGTNNIFNGSSDPGYKNLNVLSNTNTSTSTSVGTYSFARYCTFLEANGLIPAIRGQKWYPRDKEARGTTGFNTMDSFPPSGGNANYPYPSTAHFYPKPQDLASFDKSKLYDGTGAFTGVYTDGAYADTYLRPMCWVRRATLHGINAMISDELPGQDAFDQVGMVSFGTFAHRELELTNDLNLAFKTAASRLCYNVANTGITPQGNAYTNIGMGIRQGIQQVKYSTRSRDWTNKTVAILTDGVPNVSPASGGSTGNEINSSGVASITVNTGGGPGSTYSRYWADQCKTEGIILHVIAVGDGADTSLCQDLASRGGGVFFRVTNLDSNNQQLNDIFIAIGKDKLGKLYSD